jgi:hypothetical protein
MYSEKTCPNATLSTTNPTWPDPGLNPDPAVGSQRLIAWAMARPSSDSACCTCQNCIGLGLHVTFIRVLGEQCRRIQVSYFVLCVVPCDQLKIEHFWARSLEDDFCQVRSLLSLCVICFTSYIGLWTWWRYFIFRVTCPSQQEETGIAHIHFLAEFWCVLHVYNLCARN